MIGHLTVMLRKKSYIFVFIIEGSWWRCGLKTNISFHKSLLPHHTVWLNSLCISETSMTHFKAALMYISLWAQCRPLSGSSLLAVLTCILWISVLINNISFKNVRKFITLTLCILETPKRELVLQTVKTQMKCSKMLHFIRVYAFCKGKKDL